jgi:hypothetical protein
MAKKTYSSDVDWKMQRYKYEGNNSAGKLKNRRTVENVSGGKEKNNGNYGTRE